MERTILHSDCNCFYASVEHLYHPELEGKPLAVGGDPEQRHGIVLTADYMAKRRGVKTGMALWQAKQVCPELTFVPPRMDLYLDFSKMAHEIYSDYTDLQEPFGIDECWLDVTESAHVKGDGEHIAREINKRMKEELGITVSVGVSFNKIFAKFGSDYKKPDAVTVIDHDNYKNIIWNAPAADLLYVGRATERKLRKYGITTIGGIARSDPEFLESIFGKMGLMLSFFARGLDQTPVSIENSQAPIKSVGNSTTTPRSLETDEDVRLVIYILAESVATRLRKNGFIGDVIEIYVRDDQLMGWHMQHKVSIPTNLSGEIAAEAMRLFPKVYDWHSPIRSIGIRVSNLIPDTSPVQTDLFLTQEQRDKLLMVERTVDEIRSRYGYYAIQRGLLKRDTLLSSLDATADDHMIHPHSYLERGNRTGAY